MANFLNTDKQIAVISAPADGSSNPANPKRHVTVLHIPPMVSPQTAVKLQS